ncbi:MAG: FAD binding domain-containing protein [Caldilineaceae bacterium]|nr:FAD binding domain-containing protein [Caldilineaceae bacterium]
MAILHDYYRPTTLDEALTLLRRGDRVLMPLAGGTRLVGQLESHALRDIDGVVDLRDLGLHTIRQEDGRLCLGATATLAAVVEQSLGGSLASGLLRRAAQGEGPVNLRNAATVGGVVAAAEADSEFYAALLALDAQVVLHDGTRPTTIPLDEFTPRPGLITEVWLPPAAWRGGAARLARTPSDRPIVAAYAVVDAGVERVALCGVAARPILAGMPLEPPDDFKGSADYRRAMSEVVMARALDEARG